MIRTLTSAVVVLALAYVAGRLADALIDDGTSRPFLAFFGLVLVAAALLAAPLRRWVRMVAVAVAVVAAMAVIFM